MGCWETVVMIPVIETLSLMWHFRIWFLAPCFGQAPSLLLWAFGRSPVVGNISLSISFPPYYLLSISLPIFPSLFLWDLFSTFSLRTILMVLWNLTDSSFSLSIVFTLPLECRAQIVSMSSVLKSKEWIRYRKPLVPALTCLLLVESMQLVLFFLRWLYT